MSESSEHRKLIVSMVSRLSSQYPRLIIEKDIQQRPGDPVPEKIGSHRPDIFAHDEPSKFCIIGEAKTAVDLENTRSQAQICSFVNYLEQTSGKGLFLLGVSGEKANRAKMLLKFLFTDLSLDLARTELQIFDGLDYWTLCDDGARWHLS